MSIITREDLNYLAQQSAGKINMILSGMTALMDDTDAKVQTLESQTWFQRMVKTVTGKNKATRSEIQQNHDKINAYMSEAIAELFNRNCIDHEIILSLGMQLNEIYADHIQLKQMMGAFISKLNEKMDSIDNFHMLVEEIDQGVYSDNFPLVAICKILSQYDHRMLEDDRKLNIVRRSLVKQKILNDDKISLTDYLLSIIDIPLDEIGQIYLELRTIKRNYMASIMLNMIESYHFLSDMARKMKDERLLVQNVIAAMGLKESTVLSVNEIYDDFVNSKIEAKNGLISIGDRDESMLEKAEEMFLNCELDEAFELFKQLAEKGNACAMYFMGCYYTDYCCGHVIEDEEEGKKWWRRGADCGNSLALIKVSDDKNAVHDTIFEKILPAALNGDLIAQYEIGHWYIDNKDIEGLNWLVQSAESGFWKAISELGELYYFGVVVEKDYKKSVYWHRKGMECNSARSFYRMAFCYMLDDEGVNCDGEKALELFKKSYELGNGHAAECIASFYCDDESEEKILWLKRSAESGYSPAQRMLDNYYSRHGERTEGDETSEERKNVSEEKEFGAQDNLDELRIGEEITVKPGEVKIFENKKVIFADKIQVEENARLLFKNCDISFDEEALKGESEVIGVTEGLVDFEKCTIRRWINASVGDCQYNRFVAGYRNPSLIIQNCYLERCRQLFESRYDGSVEIRNSQIDLIMDNESLFNCKNITLSNTNICEKEAKGDYQNEIFSASGLLRLNECHFYSVSFLKLGMNTEADASAFENCFINITYSPSSAEYKYKEKGGLFQNCEFRNCAFIDTKEYVMRFINSKLFSCVGQIPSREMADVVSDGGFLYIYTDRGITLTGCQFANWSYKDHKKDTDKRGRDVLGWTSRTMFSCVADKDGAVIIAGSGSTIIGCQFKSLDLGMYLIGGNPVEYSSFKIENCHFETIQTGHADILRKICRYTKKGTFHEKTVEMDAHMKISNCTGL